MSTNPPADGKQWKKLMLSPVDMASRNSNRDIVAPKWDKTANEWNDNRDMWRKKSDTMRPGKKGRPLGSYRLFPSMDPYNGYMRAQFRIVNNNNSWVKRANRLMVQMIVGFGYTTTAEPRKRVSTTPLQDEQADDWATQTRFSVPWFNRVMSDAGKNTEEFTALEIKLWIDDLAEDLQLQQHLYRSQLYAREQGISAIAMFPDEREKDELGKESGTWQMPQMMRTIRPEHLNKIWLNLDTGEMDSVQVIGILANGGRMQAERLVWFMNNYNLDVNTDYYGESEILPVLDAAKTQTILYAKDFPEAAQYTWHQPKVFQVTIPPRDFLNVTNVLGQFLRKANNSQGRDIAVTQSVELISGQSNTGDIAGLVNLDDHLIEQISGYYNIPPFLLSKGKAGNLGGDAQKEEVDGFLNFEVRPRQEILETDVEDQFYDRVLMILWQTEDINEVPMRIRMHLAKPDIETLFNKEQYEVLLDMVSKKLISEDGMIKRLGLEHLRKETIASGQATPPDRSQWPIGPKWSPHWGQQEWSWKHPEGAGIAPFWNERPTGWPNVSASEKKPKTPIF